MINSEKVSRLQDRLDEALTIKGMRPIRLADQTGIPRGTISYYLKGKSMPKADRLKTICEVLNISEAWLLGYNVPMERTSVEDTQFDEIPAFDIENCDKETLNFGISKAVDILLELQIPEETIKQMILKHFDIRYSEITAILKNK